MAWWNRKTARAHSPEAHGVYERAARFLLNNQFDAAAAEFTWLIDLEADLARGYVGRGDARAAQAAALAEDYLRSGGKHFELTFDELNAPINGPLGSSEKDRWWKVTKRIMDLQYQAKLDYESALRLEPRHQHAAQMLRELKS